MNRTALGTTCSYGKDGKPFLTKVPKLLLNDNTAGKAEGIHLMIGAALARPSVTRSATGARLKMLVLHTTPHANTPMDRLRACPTAKSEPSRKRSTTKPRRTAGPSSA
jgi:hypothetical protein